MRVFITVLVTLFVLMLPVSAIAQQARLACFTEQGFKNAVSRVTNISQFFANSYSPDDLRYVRKQGCDFNSRTPSDAVRADIYQSPNGLIFPIYNARLENQRMYVTDGIFLSLEWRVTNRCGRNSFSLECIVPRTCTAIIGFINANRGSVPNYMRIPAECRLG